MANLYLIQAIEAITGLFEGRLITDPNGPNSRLRVDVGQTGFFAGREFRTFREFPTATTATFVIRAVVPINIILFGLLFDIDEGNVRIETVVGGTPGGTFSEALPIFSTNTTSDKPQPPYVAASVLTAGGTHTGGTVLDVLRVKTDMNTNRASTVGTSTSDERGIGAGTYYFRLTLTGAIGVLRARWEERP